MKAFYQVGKSTYYRDQLENLGWVLIPDAIDASLGLELRQMLEPCKQIAWRSAHQFPQRVYMNALSSEALEPFINFQNLDLANELMGGDGWRFSPWHKTSCLVPAPENMFYWCREHRDFLDESKPYHPLELWLSEFSNSLCYWRANLNLSAEEDDYLWIESGSHKWINLIEEKKRVLHPRFAPQSQSAGPIEIIRQFEQEVEDYPQLENIIVPPFGMIVMRSTLIHRGGLYRSIGTKYRNKITAFGRLTLHFAVENDVHVTLRKRIAEETIKCEISRKRWIDLSNAELEKLSIP